ncbi:hypothetical protein [Deinococcus sp. QL22]|uniref:hypothetical protein n=1 Tax=Deinococcus sp. QL22 TaxID=2939437 RepID=UPI002016C560|nr:hypothetical protein [Deinococcus sp. QL22]UQN10352.1 hypothetical protein M1R55_29820 [Deinococcus sp. QL22]UQN10486.1 hypothetical protein M1R55_29145 [Deinococcus sp. QL22]
MHILTLALVLAAPACGISLIPQATRGVTYTPLLQVARTCSPATVFRVRKSSTLNTRAAGARYQPIKPQIGAWVVTKTSSTIPVKELSTLFTWRWEVFDPKVWDLQTGQFGAWLPIRVGQP